MKDLDMNNYSPKEGVGIMASSIFACIIASAVKLLPPSPRSNCSQEILRRGKLSFSNQQVESSFMVFYKRPTTAIDTFLHKGPVIQTTYSFRIIDVA